MKYLAITFLTLGSFLSIAQENETGTRSIEVKGSSEIEITPDELFVGITLKEYKNGGDKIKLDKLEAELVRSVGKLGIDQENLMVENVSGYNWNWRKRRPDDFLGSKSFVLKVSDLKKMNDLIDALDPEGLNNVYVKSYSHSKIEDYRKQVKIGAMKAAKEKAAYLLESVGESVGKLLKVQELERGYQAPVMRSNMALQESTQASYGNYQSEVEFMKIKIRAEMRVVFEIE